MTCQKSKSRRHRDAEKARANEAAVNRQTAAHPETSGTRRLRSVMMAACALHCPGRSNRRIETAGRTDDWRVVWHRHQRAASHVTSPYIYPSSQQKPNAAVGRACPLVISRSPALENQIDFETLALTCILTSLYAAGGVDTKYGRYELRPWPGERRISSSAKSKRAPRPRKGLASAIPSCAPRPLGRFPCEDLLTLCWGQ